MACYLCGSTQTTKCPGSVRDKQEIEILECQGCGLVYLSSFEHIRDGHYENSGMHGGEEPDIDGWLKETQPDDERRYRFLKEKIINQKVLDFGCGNGGFLDIAARSARNVAGIELETALQPSYSERGLRVFPHLEGAIESGEKWDVITAFHVVEHLPKPAEILRELSSLLIVGGEIIIEVPSANDALLTLYGNSPFQNFTYWSQHLYLFNAETMKRLIEKAGLKLNWLKHIQRYPLSNHLYWLAKGKPGGHKAWVFMESEILNSAYENQLAALGLTDTIMACLSRIEG